ncbi:hypothetical protein [Falsiroseomonas tokyonensis]|uniref:Uncharacterized protein n=1 Tax=Falsiroseomonas tokyonensis TaxID=430521 RepID=A0ABV7C269_9PROT|nr:hypothetical protein [Falsiroseomonas tokyonensis]MBU8540211.1 hypothetical protein [Falsiroseomonas tokyonensis]
MTQEERAALRARLRGWPGNGDGDALSASHVSALLAEAAAALDAAEGDAKMALAATLRTLAAERDALRAALAGLDAALSNLWREGPVEAGHENHLGPVDAAWSKARTELARIPAQPAAESAP